MLELKINITTKFLVGGLKGDFFRSDHDNYSSRRFVKVTCQKCDVNLTRIHLLLKVFKHNSNLSESVILLKRMASGVWSAGDISRIHLGYSKSFTVRGLMLTWQAWSVVHFTEKNYNLMWSYHSMDENWQGTLVELTVFYKI